MDIEIRYPEQEPLDCTIVWHNNAIGEIIGLERNEWTAFGNFPGMNFLKIFNGAASTDRRKLVILFNGSNKEILKIRSLSPLNFTEEYRTIDIDNAFLDLTARNSLDADDVIIQLDPIEE